MSKKLLIGAVITALVGGIAATAALLCGKKEEEEDQNEDYGRWPDFSSETKVDDEAEQEETVEESSTITEKEVEDLQTAAAQMTPSPTVDTPLPSSDPEVPADLVKPPKKRTAKKTEEVTE